MEWPTNDTYTLVHSTQDHQIKGKKQLIDLIESINLLSYKFTEYDKDRAKKDKIIQDLKSEVDSLSTKAEKLEKLQDQQRTILKKKLSPSTWNCSRERRNNR